jgi:RNA polymerase sigma factor (sigma-70 family)
MILVKQLRLPPNDCEDLQQNMFIELAKAQKRFTPEKASVHTFASRVLDCFCKYFTRREAARRRRGFIEKPCSDLGPDFSLDKFAVGIDLVTDLISSANVARLHRVVAGLPEDLRQLCEGLMLETDKKAVAKALGIGRSSLYRRLARIREHFKEAGIEFFIPESGTHFGRLQK